MVLSVVTKNDFDPVKYTVSSINVIISHRFVLCALYKWNSQCIEFMKKALA